MALVEDAKIAVIGLGYVGLPLAVEFAKKFKTFGFDINETRIKDLSEGRDHTLEVEEEKLKAVLTTDCSTSIGLYCTNELAKIANCNFYIITVPTPVDKHNRPDLTPLYKASETVGKVLKNGDIVIYESTVYPGVTEEECVPVLERVSGLKFNTDFFAGYSPERINPGDKEHTVAKILKITSGSTLEAAEKVDQLYRSVIVAGTHKATSIKVAEAAKVIENAQRDINIAFVNELAKIFNRLNIDTDEVLQAAGTKWNFLKFKPGLVGGHCIGVDPYYLAQKAQEVGYHPEIILAGRRLNDGMGEYVAHEVIKLMVKKDIPVKGANILVLGITFKENCPDVRNTKVVDILHTLKDYDTNITIYDPWAEPAEVEREYGWDSVKVLHDTRNHDAVILAVSHDEFKALNIIKLCKENAVIYDVKGILPKDFVDARL
ncbi:nucleotide sugar dehydrogenase [Pontibacter sp. BT310]|uniref:Nucleotide sugar dehydrogenase n=1 Tax=Pontibacter populi TaxID=890055 RepID=A0ABS6XDJ0_9BACT|nr:nucleotide sugar dehydrogenase [Pontibacter sp. BT310]MBR0571627.1 nucleotide sugar dehydrogenase [Microvirga sp. STS03]MBW3366053.1 nucleotide sugar dehydrogenase [Pontibacter populi]